jgi:hypothetical protein
VAFSAGGDGGRRSPVLIDESRPSKKLHPRINRTATWQLVDLCKAAPMSDEFDRPGGDREGRGWESVLNRCRVLSAKIANELRNKRPEHFVNKLSLADIHSLLERAADILNSVNGSQAQGSRRH